MITKRVRAALLSALLVSALLVGAPVSTAGAATPALTNSIHRLAGADRYATNIAIAKAGWATSDTVCIASGGDFPDALAGSALAGVWNCPLLLVKGDDASVACKEIKVLKATKACIFGGTGVVPKSVEAQLSAAGIKALTRYGGANRYATSAAIAGGVVAADKLLSKDASTVVIATGTGFADALSIAPEAGRNGWSILLTQPTALPSVIVKELDAIKPKKIYIVGGTGAVSQGIQNTLASKYTKNITRISGADRYATSAAIAATFISTFDNSKQCFACGKNFPDALGGAPFAGRYKMPVLLVDPGSSAAAGAFVRKTGKTSFAAYALGGAAVLYDITINAVYGRYVLNVPLISQLPDFPTGCEAASTAMLITYGGRPVTTADIVAAMPYSSDPAYGYVGNPRNWTGWTIYPSAMKGVVKKYLGSGVDLTGCSINTVYSYILNNKPVVCWLGSGALPGIGMHCVCVTGYKDGTIYYNDPYLNIKNKAVSTSTFLSWWGKEKNRAMSY